MPKSIELTVEIDVQRVSCPGVWLCQDGRVSLTVFALGTSYQTCLLPPTFPLTFKDVFYFRKRFQESCALNNICCLLKEETIYCELVQWCDGCASSECGILAQYLGALNDVLFPPNMCSNEGVDLLMRRSKEFPGILSPKIEIATKVRIDEVWSQPCHVPSALKVSACHCSPRRREEFQKQYQAQQQQQQQQQQVCHSARYHRNRCKTGGPPSLTRSRSRSRSESTCSKSCCSLTPKNVEHKNTCHCPKSMDSTEEPYVDHVDVGAGAPKTIIESRFIELDKCTNTSAKEKQKNCFQPKISPCICEICKRYHELFHMKTKSG